MKRHDSRARMGCDIPLTTQGGVGEGLRL